MTAGVRLTYRFTEIVSNTGRTVLLNISTYGRQAREDDGKMSGNYAERGFG